MHVATVKIRNKRSKKVRTVNEREWAQDLGRGKYSGWTLVGNETHGDEKEPAVWTTKPVATEQETVDAAKVEIAAAAGEETPVTLAEVVELNEEAAGVVLVEDEVAKEAFDGLVPPATLTTTNVEESKPLDPPTPTRRRRRASTNTAS